MNRRSRQKIEALTKTAREDAVVQQIAKKFKARKQSKKNYGKLVVVNEVNGKLRFVSPNDTKQKGVAFYIPKSGKHIPVLVPQHKGEFYKRINWRNVKWTAWKYKNSKPLKNFSPKKSKSDTLLEKGKTRKLSAGITLDSIINGIVKSIISAREQEEFGQRWQIEVMCYLSDGDIIQTPRFQFYTSSKQTLTAAKLKSMLRDVVWSNIAQQLSERQQVTTGSFDFIKALRVNKGKSKIKWKNSKGELWNKADYKKITIQQAEHRVWRLNF